MSDAHRKPRVAFFFFSMSSSSMLQLQPFKETFSTLGNMREMCGVLLHFQKLRDTLEKECQTLQTPLRGIVAKVCLAQGRKTSQTPPESHANILQLFMHPPPQTKSRPHSIYSVHGLQMTAINFKCLSKQYEVHQSVIINFVVLNGSRGAHF